MAGLPFLILTRSNASMRKSSRLCSSIGTVAFFILYSCVAHAQPAVSKRPAEFGVVVEKKVLIPMRDGIRLAADLYRPARDGKAAEGRFPALLTRTPYDKN